ncbi:hypothetical protein T484DRAFT_1845041 [Baffinella frigidus]|nr:hypothetical protein T484DRAFT_1845041 [Cryptophyta sp. CCMP2293]
MDCFTLSHFVAYGDDIAAYATISSVMLTLYRQTLGDFDVSAMERGKPGAG